MKEVERTDRSSIFVSDGYFNLALLYQRKEEPMGLNHFGFHVKSNEEMQARAEKAGVRRGADRPERIPFAEYRVHDPEGNGIDISQKGWRSLKLSSKGSSIVQAVKLRFACSEWTPKHS